VTDDADADFGRELAQLEVELKRLEGEYNMFFAGRLPRPPWESRTRVEAMVKRLDRGRSGSYADRFRFTTLQTRLTTFIDLWDRGLRAREEGRAGPFAAPRPASAPTAGRADREGGVLYAASFSDPGREADKLQRLYQSLSDARKQAGQDPIPYDRFAELIRSQVSTLRSQGSSEVAFRVAVRDGKAALTAKVVKSESGVDEGKKG
jgi:hypothetical protein